MMKSEPGETEAGYLPSPNPGVPAPAFPGCIFFLCTIWGAWNKLCTLLVHQTSTMATKQVSRCVSSGTLLLICLEQGIYAHHFVQVNRAAKSHILSLEQCQSHTWPVTQCMLPCREAPPPFPPLCCTYLPLDSTQSKVYSCPSTPKACIHFSRSCHWSWTSCHSCVHHIRLLMKRWGIKEVEFRSPNFLWVYY